AWTQVGVDMLRKVGMDVDVVTMDWGTVQQRRAKQDPPDKGGWNTFFTGFTGTNNLDPAGHLGLRGNGKRGWFGWPRGARLEEWRDAWLAALDLAAQQGICREIQLQVWQDAPFLPLGEFFIVSAYRKTLADVPRTLPLFYGVRRA